MGENKENGKTISDWIILANSKGFLTKQFSDLHSIKSRDNEILKSLSLPRYADITIPGNDFVYKNSSLVDFLQKNKKVVIRALPNTSLLPRRFNIGVSGLEECMEFKKKFVGNNSCQYTFLLSEIEDQTYCGTIILSDEKGICEIVEGSNHTMLAQGEKTPIEYATFNTFGRILFSSLEYTMNSDEHIKTYICQALGFVNKTGIEVGYFEFVITESQGIKFIDYKQNKAYYNL